MKRGRSLTTEEIKEKYSDEWVLIEYEEIDPELNVVRGHVIAHSPIKEEIYKILMNIKDKNIAIEYTGRIPEDLALYNYSC